jgi:hypothetical protein
MLLRRRFRLSIAACVTLLMLAGCGGMKRKPVFLAEGQVFLAGQPVRHAMVIFHPVDDSDPHPVRPFGRTDENGLFYLTTYDADDGAPAGEYRVAILSGGNHLPATPPKDKSETKRPKTPKGTPIASRYAHPTTSGLTAVILPQENVLPPFQLMP